MKRKLHVILVVLFSVGSIWFFDRIIQGHNFRLIEYPQVIRHLESMLVNQGDLPIIWNVYHEAYELSREDIFDNCSDLQSSHSIDDDNGTLHQIVYDCNDENNASNTIVNLYKIALDQEWLKQNQINLQNIHADEWSYGCLENNAIIVGVTFFL